MILILAKNSSHIFKRNVSSSCLLFQVENRVWGQSAATEDEKFRVLRLTERKFEVKKRVKLNVKTFKQPREKLQPLDQDWGSVWPTARSFHPAAVPLPLRMGYPHNNNLSPDKWHNLELMKVPNFLHLTPPVVKRQCEALKKFCTKWPDGLDAEDDRRKHFPLTFSSDSYLHSSPTIRDIRARIVKLSMHIDDLKLDEHARDKLLRLVGERYDTETGIISLVADRCPLSSQNEEYVYYLLTVLYMESTKTEGWEAEKIHADYSHFVWEGSESEASVNSIENYNKENISQDSKETLMKVTTDLFDNGETEETLDSYKDAVLSVLSLK